MKINQEGESFLSKELLDASPVVGKEGDQAQPHLNRRKKNQGDLREKAYTTAGKLKKKKKTAESIYQGPKGDQK